jgi:lipopolysaccharide transport system ATP-binding protein
MGPGSYSVSVALHADDKHISKNYLWQDRTFLFTVVNAGEPVFVGSHCLPTLVEVTSL